MGKRRASYRGRGTSAGSSGGGGREMIGWFSSSSLEWRILEGRMNGEQSGGRAETEGELVDHGERNVGPSREQ